MNRQILKHIWRYIMKLLFKLTDKDFFLEPKEMKNFELRTASRGLIFGDDGKIAIQFKTNKNERNEF